MKINIFDNGSVADKIGGGFSFFRNFKQMLVKLGHKISNTDYDISIATSPTVVSWDDWNGAVKKPRVLRADGVPEDWRNRGTGWSRLKGFAKDANLVIYQSNFTANTVGRLLGKKGTVIINGLDKNIFKPTGDKMSQFGSPSLLFVNFRNDPNKRFQEAIERFRQYKIDNQNATMTFVGDYPKEQVFWSGKKYDFGLLDMKQDKDWRYLGIIKDRNELAKIMRSHDYICYPSFADPCPNTLVEALCCGCKPLWLNDYGSSNEIVNLYENNYDFSLEHMTKIYVEKMGKII